MTPVIPPKKNRKELREYDEYLYKFRHRVENAFLLPKRWRGIAARCAQNAASFVAACTATVTPWALAAVASAVWTKPLPASTPVWHFVPKCHWLPFFVWCISGPRFFSAFLVELGALMSVSSTMLPPCIHFWLYIRILSALISGYQKNLSCLEGKPLAHLAISAMNTASKT